MNQTIREQMARECQVQYEQWDQDENGEDVEFGTGGICDAMAETMGSILAEHGFDVMDGGQPGDDHAWIIAIDELGQEWAVDLPYSIYEFGGGYVWHKIPDVIISADDFYISRI